MAGVRTLPIKIRSELELDVEGLTKAELAELYRPFTYSNSQFYKLQKMGKWVGNVPRTIETYRTETNIAGKTTRVWFPRGGVQKLDQAALAIGLDLDFIDDRLTLPDVEFEPYDDAAPVNLRDDQTPIVEAILEKENAVIRAPTGSGKTEILIEAIRRAQQPALIIVLSKALLDQWTERIEARWGWPATRIGQIGSGRHRIGDITVAMHQSLRTRIDGVKNEFGFVAMDEVHHAGCETCRELMGQFPARFRVGVSADERRKDGLEDAIRDIFGPVAVEVSRERLISQGRIAEVEVVIVPTDHRPSPAIQAMIDEAPSQEKGRVLGNHYVKVLDWITADQARNDLTGRLAAEEASHGRSTLVFTDRVEHAYELARVISTRYQTPCGTLVGGAENRAAFEETRSRLYDGSLKVAVGTSCVYEGFDVPRLEVGIVATPSASNRQRVEQQVGRLRRLFPGKTIGTLYYLWDEHLFASHRRKMEGYYGRKLVRLLGA